MDHIFISYSKKDIAFARHLRRLLEDENFGVWMDETQLVPSEQWWPAIERTIETCAAFIVIMSPEARRSRWVEREILWAEKHSKPICPILLVGEAWSRLAEIQYDDMTAGEKATLSPRLVEALAAVVPRNSPNLLPPQLEVTAQAVPITPKRESLWWAVGITIAILVVLVILLASVVFGQALSPIFPLLLGAILIERILEFLFSWSERAILNATDTLKTFAKMITGITPIDLKEPWHLAHTLTRALQIRSASGIPPEAGNPGSADPSEWPQAELEFQLAEIQRTLSANEAQLAEIINSSQYRERKKMEAAVMGTGMGITLALAADLRLFAPLNISVAGWFEQPFSVIDLILAGILMGLGADWVHQLIVFLAKDRNLLGSLGRIKQRNTIPVDNSALISQIVSNVLQQELDARLQTLREEAQQEIGDIPPPPPPQT